MKMELSGSAIVALSTVLAVVVSSGLSGLGTLIEERWKRRRELKEVLYNLLRVWDVVYTYSRRPKTEEVMEAFLKELGSRFSESEPNKEELQQAKESVAPIAGPYLQDVWKKMTDLKRSGSLRSRYTEAVQQLSPRTPILAFRLSNNERLDSTLNELDQALDKYEEKLRGDEPGFSFGNDGPLEPEKIEEVKEETSSLIADKMITDLEGHIMEVASEIGLGTENRVKEKMESIKEKRDAIGESPLESGVGETMVDQLEDVFQEIRPEEYEELQNQKSSR